MIRKDGKWGRRLYTLIPSYVFVDIKFAAQIYYTIRAIPSVIRFVGTGCGEPPPSPIWRRSGSGCSRETGSLWSQP